MKQIYLTVLALIVAGGLVACVGPVYDRGGYVYDDAVPVYGNAYPYWGPGYDPFYFGFYYDRIHYHRPVIIDRRSAGHSHRHPAVIHDRDKNRRHDRGARTGFDQQRRNRFHQRSGSTSVARDQQPKRQQQFSGDGQRRGGRIGHEGRKRQRGTLRCGGARC